MNEELWNEYCGAIDRVIVETGNPSRADAAAIVKQRYPRFRGVLPPGMAGSAPSRPSPAPGTRAESASAELDRRARLHQQSHPGMTFARAYVAVLNSDARLYVRYLEEHAARLQRESARA